jgi:outer membrane beta-barrel protein
MESRFQHILLTPAGLVGIIALCGALLNVSPVRAAEPSELELEPLVLREPERREVSVDRLDTEDFEIGVYGGLMHVDDFGSEPVAGLRFAYHVTEDFFVEAAYARTKLGETSFEQLSGGATLLADDDRDMSYYNVSIGWNLFPGETFVANRWAFKGGLYLIAGAGSTEFGGDDLFTLNAGVGYRFIATDWLALHIDVRDHYFESDLLGRNEGKHNIELSGSLTYFF